MGNDQEGLTAVGSLAEVYGYYKDKPICGYRFYGASGTALREPAADAREEEVRSWVKGRIGEKLFMSIASEKGLLNRCVSFWSLTVREDCDLDCAFLFEDALVVVDVKSWAATTSVKNPEGLRKTVGDLESAIRDHDAAIEVVPYIVFVPTVNQELHESETFSNGIRGLKYTEFFQEVADARRPSCGEGSEAGSTASWLESYLGGMVKNRPSVSFGETGDEAWDNERWKKSYRDLFQKLQSCM